ncbi:hypothetical protein BH20ACT2_BH20ACT2_24540 [soil metagenome]
MVTPAEPDPHPDDARPEVSAAGNESAADNDPPDNDPATDNDPVAGDPATDNDPATDDDPVAGDPAEVAPSQGARKGRTVGGPSREVPTGPTLRQRTTETVADHPSDPADEARLARRRSRKERAGTRRAASQRRAGSPAAPDQVVGAPAAAGEDAATSQTVGALSPHDPNTESLRQRTPKTVDGCRSDPDDEEITVSAEAAAVHAAQRERAFPVGPVRLVLETAPLALLAVLVAGWLYRVGDASLRMTPLYQDRSDARLIASMVKTIHTEGWYLTNPLLGAPFGQQLYDFPHGGENLQLGLIRLLSSFTDGYAHTMNLYFLGGFGLLAGVTLLVLRHLRFSYPVAALIAVIYTFLPYHFFHEQAHLYRSTYFSAPLACLLLIWALSPGVAFRRPPADDAGRGAIRWGRVVVAVALCVVVATTETMSTAFTMTLLASGGLVLAIRHRHAGRLIAPALMVLAIAAVFLVSNFPTLDYYADEGTNDRAARREIIEQELYGLKLSRLVLPPGNHRSEALGDLGSRAGRGTVIRSEGGQYLGIIGVAGFLGALYGAFARGIGRRADPWRPLHDRRHLLERSSLLVVLAVLFGTISGFAILLSLAGFSQVRVWNRILILIAFFSLLWVATWFERLVGAVRRRWPRVVAMPGLGLLGVAVAAFALWDGAVPADRDYDRLDAQVRSDRAFVADIEAALPDGAAVFQLPVIAFPETPPPGDMLDYDHLRGFLASEGSLRWSYGAIKGRPEADWQRPVGTDVSVVGSLPALVGMGFEGLWLDTFGYDGDTGAELASDIEAATAFEPVVSPDGRFLFFDLERFIRELDRTPEQLADEAERVLDVRPPGSR